MDNKLPKHQGGIALVIVLWMLALMTIIALAYSSMLRTETLLSNNMIRAAQARTEAEAGVWLTVKDILKPIKKRLLTTDGESHELHPISQHRLIVSVQDESGKIDLNRASQQLLISLIKSTGTELEQASHVADAIIDWRDSDKLKRLNGAEDEDYESNGYSYGAKDGSFNSIGELRYVHGINPSLYEKLQALVTIHSMQPRVRLNAAPIGVLNALPEMTEELATRILAGRKKSVTVTIPPTLPASITPLVAVSGQGKVFSVTSEARVNGVTSRLRVIFALKKSTNKPVTILGWHENAPSPTRQQELLLENVRENAPDY